MRHWSRAIPRRAARGPILAVPVLLAALILGGAPMVLAASAPRSCYPPPVGARVVRPFVEPRCPYCPGHRGLDYDTTPGQRIDAVAAGSVSFAGLVAGTRYVVINQDDGRRATYGQLASSTVRARERVAAGDRVGTASDTFFFGFREPDDRYIDPAPLLGTWRRRSRLVPVDGTGRRPGPPPRLVCGNAHQHG